MIEITTESGTIIEGVTRTPFGEYGVQRKESGKLVEWEARWHPWCYKLGSAMLMPAKRSTIIWRGDHENTAWEIDPTAKEGRKGVHRKKRG